MAPHLTLILTQVMALSVLSWKIPTFSTFLFIGTKAADSIPAVTLEPSTSQVAELERERECDTEQSSWNQARNV
jgi:hypothetical protein